MPKHYKEVVEDIINKMNEAKAKEVEEDAPANSVAGGGVDLAPNAAVSQSPHMVKRKKEQGAEQEKIKNKIKKMVQNNEDNNNIVLKQVLDGDHLLMLTMLARGPHFRYIPSSGHLPLYIVQVRDFCYFALCPNMKRCPLHNIDNNQETPVLSLRSE